ncbi:CsgG/HfaB family protein [Lysobacter sp. LF1]|uniref:CsgG/HfaB family protein n=1 Tax=Lysobacter stagni TaxID=3045172 RepID=A0ABT6XEF3_9GAMM|nr:CsgG/HfaB family protein [Lysobacter sp. LF1]MDI9238526.1 CsgG/HfaB family protein [Lysobacter sp. LF1]
MKGGKTHVVVAAGTLGLSVLLGTGPALAGADREGAKRVDMPVCDTRLGSISVIEPEDSVDWWSGQQLPAPSKLIKAFVNQSGCFTLVDRGAGLDAALAERELSYGGELRAQSNVGKGQVRAADYVLVPDLVARNENAGGASLVAGLLGAVVGGDAGSILASMDFRKKTADVVLTLTDVRSSEQVATVDGSAKKSDVSLGGATLWHGTRPGGIGLSGYTNTEIGRVIALAYLQAYAGLVEQMRGRNGAPSADNAQRAVTVIKPARLFTTAAGTKVVRGLDAGMMLYPTGNKDGVMWEAEDEFGNKGWVSSTLLELSKRDPRDS